MVVVCGRGGLGLKRDEDHDAKRGGPSFLVYICASGVDALILCACALAREEVALFLVHSCAGQRWG